MGILHLEYKEDLKEDYCKNYFEIFYDENRKIFQKIYLYSSQYGTIELKNGKKEIHKWETEDEAQANSYLNRNYPIICLDGIANDSELEKNIILENMNYIKTLKLKEQEMFVINNAINYLAGIKDVV